MPSRAYGGKTPVKSTSIQAPQRAHEWQGLLRRAIEAAAAVSDARLPLLRAARDGADAEKVLRRLSIIHDADIAREFPATK